MHYGEIIAQLHASQFNFKHISRDTNLTEVFQAMSEQFKDIRTPAKS